MDFAGLSPNTIGLLSAPLSLPLCSTDLEVAVSKSKYQSINHDVSRPRAFTLFFEIVSISSPNRLSIDLYHANKFNSQGAQ